QGGSIGGSAIECALVNARTNCSIAEKREDKEELPFGQRIATAVLAVSVLEFLFIGKAQRARAFAVEAAGLVCGAMIDQGAEGEVREGMTKCRQPPMENRREFRTMGIEQDVVVSVVAMDDRCFVVQRQAFAEPSNKVVHVSVIFDLGVE